jgi:hypothetical protein
LSAVAAVAAVVPTRVDRAATVVQERRRLAVAARAVLTLATPLTTSTSERLAVRQVPLRQSATPVLLRAAVVVVVETARPPVLTAVLVLLVE